MIETQHGRHGVRLVEEGGDDPEIAAAPTQRPEQIWMMLGVRGDNGGISRDDLEGQNIVAGQPVLAREPADAATQGQPGNAGPRDDAGGNGQAVQVSLAVHVAQRRATLHPDGPPVCVDEHAAHRRKIDDDPMVAHRPAADIVATAAPATSRSLTRANFTAQTASATPRQRAITPGYLSMLAFQILRARS